MNCELIEQVEITPDTVITLVNGQKIIVRESAEQIRERTIEYRRQIFAWAPPPRPHGLTIRLAKDQAGSIEDPIGPVSLVRRDGEV